MASQNLRTKQQFLYELERFHNETYAKALLVDPEAFFQPAQQGWSVAENFTHITKVARTMALIFAPISAPVIGMMGHHTGELSQLKQMMLDYHAGLKKGFNAGPFRPATESPGDEVAAYLSVRQVHQPKATTSSNQRCVARGEGRGPPLGGENTTAKGILGG